MIDFDYNATTPLKESVRTQMEPFLNGQYGNPSSIHQVGQKTKAAVEEAREKIAQSVNAETEALVLTGSGSEANTLAIRGVLDHPLRNNKVITTPVEHSSVKDTIEWLKEKGTQILEVPMTEAGHPDLTWLDDNITADTDLVTIMTVNNETGTIFPIREIGRLCAERDVTFHSDAVQAYGKISLDFKDLPVDMMSVSAHKIGGPKGVGALFAPKKINLDPLIFGGSQERDRRGGTENVPGIVGFGVAAENIDVDKFKKVSELRDHFEEKLKEEIDNFYNISSDVHRVANTSGILFEGIDGEDVVIKLDMAGYAVATGSACTSGSSQPSHVIRSIPLPDKYKAENFVRFSFSPDHTKSNVMEGAAKTLEIIDELRNTEISFSEPTREVAYR